MKRNLTLTLLALAAAAGPLQASADTQKTGFSSVVICTQTGESLTVTLSDDILTTFSETDITFADAENTVTLPLARLRSYSFVPAVLPEGLTQIPLVQHATAIYTADGQRISSLDGAPAGLYIVKHGQASIKIYHK